MGEYMQVAFYTEVKEPSLFSGNKERLLYELSKAISTEQQDAIFKKYSLYDEQAGISMNGLLNIRFWDFKGKRYATNDGLYGLYSIFPPHHLYYKWHLPSFWLLMTTPEEFEHGRTFGRVILSASTLQERVMALEECLEEDAYVKTFLHQKQETVPNDESPSLFDTIKKLPSTALVYINLGNVLTNFDEPSEETEVQKIQKMRANLLKEMPCVAKYLQRLSPPGQGV